MRFHTRITMPTFVLLLIVAGCQVGSTGHDLAPARTGRGITIQLTTTSDLTSASLRKHPAEVLDVQTDSLLLRSLLLRSRRMSQQKIFRIAYSAIEEAGFDDLSQLNFGSNGPSSNQRERLRLLSRFPQGVDEDLLRRLLNAYDQDTLRTIP